jgi:glycosyltransferase involved in cell wall biosynthesis
MVLDKLNYFKILYFVEEFVIHKIMFIVYNVNTKRQKMSKPEISVICCNYNHAQYIEQAVQSIVNQTFSNWELLIVDDGSTDNSKEVINEIVKLDKERIREPIFLPQNKGKWFALNTALAKANGKLVTLCDADDSSHSYRLERQYNVLQDQKSFMVMTGFKHCYNDKDIADGLQWDPKQRLGYDIIDHTEVTKKVLEGLKTLGINHFYIGHDYECHGASGLYYKLLWERGMKYLPGNMGLRVQLAEDSDFNTKMTLLLQKTCVLKEPLYLYRRGTSTNNAYLEGK